MSAIVVVEKAFFFNGIKLVLPGLPTLPLGADVLAGAWLEGGGEASRGGLPGVGAERRVGVGVRRGAHWAEHWARLERVGRLLPIVGVPRRALHVVDWPAGGPPRRGLAQATHLRVCLGQH